MNLTVTPSAATLTLAVDSDSGSQNLTVGTASPVNLSVSGGRGPAGIGNATLAAGNGIAIGQAGNTATISSTRNSLADLADVTLSSPAAGQVLSWNGTTWTAAADSTNLSGYATESYVDLAVANLVDSSPAALDTLNELAAAIGDDANFSATITASLAGKASLNHTHNIADVTGLQAALDAKAASGNYTLIGHTHTSANITDFAVASAANAPIQSVNCLTGDIVLVAGTGLTLGQLGTTLTLNADLPPSNLADLADVSGSPSANQALIYNGTEWQPGDIPAGTTINGLSGNLTLAAGDNVTLTVANSTLTFSASGGGVGSLDAGTYPRGDSLLTESGDTLTSEAGDQLSPEQATSNSSAVIQLLRSNVAAAVPSSLAAGELAINTQDELLFYENSSGAVQSFPLRSYAVADHTHDIADVTGLQAALDAKAATASLANVATSGNYSDLAGRPTLGTAAATDVSDYATAAQGTLADSAVQPADLATVATSGSYSDLSGIPTEFTPATHTHTSADVTDFATAAAANAPIQNINNLTGSLTLAEGSGMTITESGSTITFAASSGSAYGTALLFG